MSWRGFATGALGLLALETIVQPAASRRASGLVNDIAEMADKFLNPRVAAISAPPKQSPSESGGAGFFGLDRLVDPSGVAGKLLAPLHLSLNPLDLLGL